ncbi:MAG: iron-containing redox enzyme family protein [Ramlibacter sp.]|nr:iron-containing redox enzyme family protein [Ramlibacter sp.]
MHNGVAQAHPISTALPRAFRVEAGALAARLLAHPFMQRCADGTVSMAQLRRFLVQQGKYSAHFTRYLCALISNLAEAEDVLRLASNLAEELGYGEHGGVPHSRLYAQMLRGFGLSLDDEPTGPQTQGLIDTMLMLCRQPGGLAGLGALCLGAEAVVPAVYSRVIDGFTSQGVDSDGLAFFSIHVECDDDHAQTMFEMVDRLCSESPVNRSKVLNGAEIAVNARLRFFDALAGEQH